MKESHKSMPQIVAWVMSSNHNRRVFCQSQVSGVRESDRVVTELLPELSLSPAFKKAKKEEGCAVMFAREREGKEEIFLILLLLGFFFFFLLRFPSLFPMS